MVGDPGWGDANKRRVDLGGLLESNPWMLRLVRKVAPGRVWDGSGLIVAKRRLGPFTVALPVNPLWRGWERPFRKTVGERWVLIVRDHAGREHPVNVDEPTWRAHDVGDVISSDDPLRDRR